MIVAALAAALAEEPPADDEIVVWGDRFTRWEQRWWVETEVTFAEPFQLLAERNLESRLDAVRVRAALDCDRTTRLGAAREEVDCVIEDVALLAASSFPGRSDDAVLAEADAALQGARVQLQVDAAGRVQNVDVEGLTARNRRDAERIEGFRQLLSRVILPFHLALPDVVARSMRWEEPDSRLLSMPSTSGSGGSSRIVHTMTPYEGLLLVQSIGEATLLPSVGVDSFSLEGGVATARGEAVASFALRMDGVAVFDPRTGVLLERVWSVIGERTAAGPAAVSARGYRHTGRFRVLGDAERPDLGATAMLPPGTPLPPT